MNSLLVDLSCISEGNLKVLGMPWRPRQLCTSQGITAHRSPPSERESEPDNTAPVLKRVFDMDVDGDQHGFR